MSSVSALNSLLSSSSSTSTSSSVDISSLLAAATGASSTGIDVTTAVTAAIYAAQAPERQWEAQQTTAKSQITALTAIQTALSSVTTDLQSLNDLDGPTTARTVSSSSSAIATATATAGTTIGNHVVVVNSLASSASWYSAAVPSSSSSLGTDSLQITSQSGTVSSFTLGSGTDSLTELASAINTAGVGVTASVVTDTSGARLALVGSATGASSDFSVSFGAATGTSWTSSSVASASSTLQASSFDVGDGTTTATINVTAGETLSSVASDINSQGLGLTASVVTDSSGAHLSVAGSSGNTVSVSADPTLSFTRTSQAADASLTVDGVPITSASNTVTGAVSGVSINLVSASQGTKVTLGVAADSTGLTSALSQFVTDYNSAISLVNTQFTYSSSTSSEGVLSGDSSVLTLQSAMMQAIGYSSSSSSSTSSSSTSSSTISTLAALGITMGDDGSLTLDSSKLATAISSNPSGVQSFLQGSALNGFAASFTSSLNTFTDSADGSLTEDISNLNQQYTALQTNVDDYENGYIASQRTVLTAMYSQAEIALQSLPTTLKQIQAQLGSTSGS